MRRAWRDWRDLPRMQDLLARALRDRPSQADLHPGDLAWWLGWPPKAHKELAETTTLWEAEGRLRAWITVDGDDVGECVDDVDGATELWSDIDRCLDGRPGLTRFARADDDVSLDRLAAAGYRRIEGGSMLGFSLDLTGLEVGEPDPRVRPVAPGDDLRPRASVTRAAFNVDRPLERYVAEYASFVASPAYPSGWDLVAWASPSAAAACTIAWPDPVSLVGNFEPVATHPDFQRRGYATAVLREGIRRLQLAGMTRAIVRTPVGNQAGVALYRSAGFADDHELVAFRQVRTI